jgi:hypothetical protein
MIVDIRNWGSAHTVTNPTLYLGIFVPKVRKSVFEYEVINKQVFFLSVIKYGIEFTEVQSALSREKKMLTVCQS